MASKDGPTHITEIDMAGDRHTDVIIITEGDDEPTIPPQPPVPPVPANPEEMLENTEAWDDARGLMAFAIAERNFKRTNAFDVGASGLSPNGPESQWPVTPLTPEFTFTPDPPTSGDTEIVFEAGWMVPPVGHTYLWTFGGDGTSTELNPTHTFSAPATYAVTLEVTNTLSGQSATSDAVDVVIVA